VSDSVFATPDKSVLAGRPCRSCGADGLVPVLDLGKTPLADALVPAERLDAPEHRYSLVVAFCPSCTLVQHVEDLAEAELFDADYPYYSSFSPYLLQHSREHALAVIEERGLGTDNLVVELASNDGYLLKNFVEAGIPVLGIEPTPGPAGAALDAGVPTMIEFFGIALAEKLRAEGKVADVILANNVMAHVPDLNGFVAGMALLLADDGVIHVENPYVRDLIEHCEFDTIYHEHFCYYSCTAVSALAERHGLHLVDVEYFQDLHGGTLRWHLAKHTNVSETAKRYLAEEQESGLTELPYYEGFAERVVGVKRDLLALLRGLREEGKTIAAYGAAAKGATLVNYVGITTDLVEFVVDRNVHKQGRFMPGTHQEVLDPSALIERKPDYVLLLAWNFAKEIAEQQAEYRAAGGKFIVPVPTPRILP
jgi:SAM-dependent methyltransferase